MNPLTIFRKKDPRNALQLGKNLKTRILKNKDGLLSAMGEKLDGNKCCPRLLGEPCIGEFCMFWMKFKSIDNKTKEEKEFFNCVDVQTPLLIIEQTIKIQKLTEALENQKGDKSDEKII